ncbi:hypothetical protein H696_06286 [Fonticula alba]|uniref:Uncharacterized protein n=1 Tax=Fonticula alba TaxID=691883 RepID=A0A058YZ76_FONAL|nr:hypothetical protein H696_06286 [Fonticula alba]KCV67294.1 hypothetical protein H696_06286 [Fonticula alba]|eukprot:XP_009498301.1 hypothetical protein H696_06286 [Fonticula alba]
MVVVPQVGTAPHQAALVVPVARATMGLLAVQATMVVLAITARQAVFVLVPVAGILSLPGALRLVGLMAGGLVVPPGHMAVPAPMAAPMAHDSPKPTVTPFRRPGGRR